MTAVPPAAAARPTAVTGQQTVPPGGVRTDVPPEGVPPGGARQAPDAAATPDADAIERQQHTSGLIAGSALTGALFMGAGLAMCIPFLGWTVPFLIGIGIVTGLDFLADMAGFSPVKWASGKSIGGWIASGFTSTPREPEGQQGVGLRRPPAARRSPIETQPLPPPDRRDQPPADALPATS